MNVNAKIMTALQGVNLPVSYLVHKEADSEYITYNYADERPVVYADDEDIIDSATMQVHYFTKGNPSTKKKAIRDALRQAGFTIQSVQEVFEDDTGFVHVVIYAWVEGPVD